MVVSTNIKGLKIMFFCERNKPEHNETIRNGDDPVADISLDGSGFSSNGQSFFGFNLIDGSVSGDDLTMRGRGVSISEKDGDRYIELKWLFGISWGDPHMWG
jgi:hypothetical protein